MKMKLILLTIILLLSASLLNAQPIVTKNENIQIFGGKLSEPGTRSWTVALVHTKDIKNSSSQFCGGSVIGKKEVLTAAHCVYEKRKEDIQILSGTQNLVNGGSRINVKEILLPKEFIPRKDKNYNWDYDIAILKLESSPIENSIEIISQTEEPKYISPNTAVTTMGWGKTDAGTYPNELLEVELPIVDNKICANRYKREGLEITDRMLCAGYKQGKKDSCQGDSGGPLIVHVAGKVEPIQVGIVSWALPECGGVENYGVYTRLSKFSSWIKEHVSHNDVLNKRVLPKHSIDKCTPNPKNPNPIC